MFSLSTLRFFISFDFIFIVMFIAGMWNAFTTRRKKGTYINGSMQELYGDLAPLARGRGIKINSKPTPQRQPRLRVNKSEERCREIFEQIFNKPFPSVRPDFLKNPSTKRNLELDGYCPDIITPMGKGLAFEYDGIQHHQPTRHFHGNNPYEFVYQVQKDRFKDSKCREMGILLIRIPHYIPYHDLERNIRNKLKQHKVKI